MKYRLNSDDKWREVPFWFAWGIWSLFAAVPTALLLGALFLAPVVYYVLYLFTTFLVGAILTVVTRAIHRKRETHDNDN